MRRNFKNFFKVIILTFLLVVTGSVSIFAKEVLTTDVTTASDGNILLGISGTFSYVSENEILERINAIRLEACTEGVINPLTGKPLTIADYKELKWSSDLEWIAQIRAAEATVYEAHIRPNGTTCFTLSHNGISSSAEDLAWNYSGLMHGIEQWYDEKDDWIAQNSSAATGHYTSLINPSYSCIGIGCFVRSTGGWYAVAAEFGYMTDADESKSVLKGEYIQMLEVQDSYCSSAEISGKNSVIVGNNRNLSLTMSISYPGILGDTNVTTGIVPENVTWSSSDTSIATISTNGVVTSKKVGTVKITAKTESGLKAAFKITVNPPKKGAKIKKGNVTYKVTTRGETVSYFKYSGFAKNVKIPATVKIDGVKYKVTAVEAGAFKKNTQIKKITIGRNIVKIGKQAFYGCKNLKTIVIKTKKLTNATVKANAFKGIYKKAAITVPSNRLNRYKKLLLDKGVNKKASITSY